MIPRLLLALAALSLYAADVNGKWTAEFDSQIGRQRYSYEFKADGATLTGKIIHAERGASDVKEGKVNGDEVSFVEIANVQGNELRIEHKGKIIGDEMKLHRKVGDFAEYDIVLKRAK
jgi:hypothetical protein